MERNWELSFRILCLPCQFIFLLFWLVLFYLNAWPLSWWLLHWTCLNNTIKTLSYGKSVSVKNNQVNEQLFLFLLFFFFPSLFFFSVFFLLFSSFSPSSFFFPLPFLLLFFNSLPLLTLPFCPPFFCSLWRDYIFYHRETDDFHVVSPVWCITLLMAIIKLLYF